MNIKNAQLAVDNWIKDHGVRYFNELTNMAQLTEEVGEVARIIARRYGEQSEKESDKNFVTTTCRVPKDLHAEVSRKMIGTSDSFQSVIIAMGSRNTSGETRR